MSAVAALESCARPNAVFPAWPARWPLPPVRVIGWHSGKAGARGRLTLHSALPVALKDLVAGLARDPELTAQRSHCLAVLEPDLKPHALVHHRTPSMASPLRPFR